MELFLSSSTNLRTSNFIVIIIIIIIIIIVAVVVVVIRVHSTKLLNFD